jgi:ribonuclease D
MSNITFSVDDRLIEEGRRYAREHQTSLNAMLRSLLERTVRGNRTDWVDECFREMDAAPGHSNGKKWKREELYRA